MTPETGIISYLLLASVLLYSSMVLAIGVILLLPIFDNFNFLLGMESQVDKVQVSSKCK